MKFCRKWKNVKPIVSLIRSLFKQIWHRLISMSCLLPVLMSYQHRRTCRKVIFAKLGCVVRMVVDFILPHAESGPNDHRKGAPQFNRWTKPLWNSYLARDLLCKIYRSWGESDLDDSDVDEQGLNSILIFTLVILQHLAEPSQCPLQFQEDHSDLYLRASYLSTIIIIKRCWFSTAEYMVNIRSWIFKSMISRFLKIRNRKFWYR